MRWPTGGGCAGCHDRSTAPSLVPDAYKAVGGRRGRRAPCAPCEPTLATALTESTMRPSTITTTKTTRIQMRIPGRPLPLRRCPGRGTSTVGNDERSEPLIWLHSSVFDYAPWLV